MVMLALYFCSCSLLLFISHPFRFLSTLQAFFSLFTIDRGIETID